MPDSRLVPSDVAVEIAKEVREVFRAAVEETQRLSARMDELGNKCRIRIHNKHTKKTDHEMES